MKYLHYIIIGAMAFGMASCIEETLPSDGYMTSDQISQRPDALDGFVNAIVGMPVTAHKYMDDYYVDCGYPGLGMMRDCYTEDFPIYNNSYDYFSYYSTNTYLGEYGTSDWPWNLYYKYIGNCNNVIRLEMNENTERQFGIAYFYRAFFYFDIARMYEYKSTGFAELDGLGDPLGSVTVPIIKENTTEAEARNTPRAPYHEMYRFILDDLEKAEELLKGKERVSRTHPDVAAVKGLLARVYLEIGTHFEKKPADLDAAVAAGVDLGAATANAAFAKAANYAQEAIAGSGAPMDKATWQSTGFIDINTPAWMLGFAMNKEILAADSWVGWISFMAPETLYGLAGMSNASGSLKNTYTSQRMISTALYSLISDSDWRKYTWVSPDDAGSAANKAKYNSPVTDEFFALFPAYTGLKFRPRNGELTDYTTGSAVDYPLMRVEEMYFIKAEALAASQGVAAGISVLKDFLNTYRYTDGSYDCTAGDLTEFRRQLMIQKRIEFWGEGLMAWDYKRLCLQVRRGYEGSNFPEHYMLNSKDGYCAPWLNAYFLKAEVGMNPALKSNPDPSIVSCKWN